MSAADTPTTCAEADGASPDIVENSLKGPIKITISDPETGKVLEERVLQNDYAIICAGNRYVKNIQVMGRTHMLAVATMTSENANGRL